MSRAADVSALRPGYKLNRYPERSDRSPGYIEHFVRSTACAYQTRRTRVKALQIGHRVAARVESVTRPVSYAELNVLRQMLEEGSWSDPCLEETLITIGQQVRSLFGFYLHATQYAGAWAMLQGRLIEMATGEGKTVTAAVAAIIAGLSGAKVHVITTNDYLVERDANEMRALYESFDLTCGHVVQKMEDEQRREAYGSDICYVSNKTLVFDYLRDRQSMGRDPSTLAAKLRTLSRSTVTPPLLNGLSFAIVDEADSALIDDAITPLILSHQADSSDEMALSVTALSLAQRLFEGTDFRVSKHQRTVQLTRAGEQHLEGFATGLEGVWSNRRYCLERVNQALVGLHIFKRDVDYMVREEKVVLIDQSTGRMMPDRKLQNGLHQILETKEKCELSGRTQTIASLSFQKFFTRYTLLAGMSGTASEASKELVRTYNLGVVPVPTHRVVNRTFEGARFARSPDEYLSLLGNAAADKIARGQSVLVGTRSLSQSESISAYFTSQGLEHSVLNARQDEDEARLVAEAGKPSRITIATNMAGRGTDIKIDEEVRNSGGLHVVVSQLNDSVRIDRQLIGRCSRQGDPGSFEYVISPDDAVMIRGAKRSGGLSGFDRVLARSAFGNKRLFSKARRIQKKIDKEHRALRRYVAKADERMQRSLAFTGYKE